MKLNKLIIVITVLLSAFSISIDCMVGLSKTSEESKLETLMDRTIVRVSGIAENIYKRHGFEAMHEYLKSLPKELYDHVISLMWFSHQRVKRFPSKLLKFYRNNPVNMPNIVNDFLNHLDDVTTRAILEGFVKELYDLYSHQDKQLITNFLISIIKTYPEFSDYIMSVVDQERFNAAVNVVNNALYEESEEERQWHRDRFRDIESKLTQIKNAIKE